jgi:hypothetical protein
MLSNPEAFFIFILSIIFSILSDVICWNYTNTLIVVPTGVFPDSLKKAQVTPLHKKNDPLSKTNYRPVSVLPVFSKIFEKVFETQ